MDNDTSDLHDRLYDRKHVDRKDKEFYIALAKKYGPETIELGCGTGRILSALLKENLPAIGVDFNQNRLDICRQRLEANDIKNASSYISRADIRDFSSEKKYDLAIMPFRVFQFLLEPEDQQKCLTSVAALLKDGGYVLVDVYNPSIPHLANVGATEVTSWEEDGKKITLTDHFKSVNYAKQIATYTEAYSITHPDGTIENTVDEYKMRYIFRGELEHLLRLNGFEVVETYADYNFTPASPENYPGETLMLCKKTAPKMKS